VIRKSKDKSPLRKVRREEMEDETNKINHSTLTNHPTNQSTNPIHPKIYIQFIFKYLINLGIALAEEWGAPFYETSAFTQVNNEECFLATAREIKVREDEMWFCEKKREREREKNSKNELNFHFSSHILLFLESSEGIGKPKSDSIHFFSFYSFTTNEQ